MYRFVEYIYAIAAIALSSAPLTPGDAPDKLTQEFSSERLIAAGERGGPLTPTSEKFNADDNRSFGLAMGDWNAHRYDMAVDKFRAHLTHYPRSPWAAEAELHIGCYSFYRGRYEAAEESFLRILNKQKKGQIARKALIRLGIMYADSSRLEEAASCFKQCVALKPTWQQATLCQSWRMNIHRMKMNRKDSSGCGPLALKRIFGLQGIPFPNEFIGKESSSFFDIVQIAAEQDVEAVGLKLTYEDLIGLKEPVIVRVHPPHFLVVGRADSRNVFTIDPQGGKRVIPHDRFVSIWDGDTLLFNPGKEHRGTCLSKVEMGNARGGCCGFPPLADDLGGTVDDVPAGGPQGGGTGGCGSPSVSINPRSLNISIKDTPIGYRPARGPAVEFKLAYNSLDPQEGTGGGGGFNYYPFGSKWSSNFDSHYLLDPNGNVTVVMPDGKRDVYIRNAPPDERTFTPPPRVYHTLVENLDGSYTLRLKTSKVKYHYSPTHQIISSVEDRWGNRVIVNRDADGRLAGVTDATGRTTSLVSDENGRITSITDPIGRIALFSYDGDGNLVSVTDMGGYTYSYAYLWDDEYGFVLSSLTRPTGTWTFAHTFPDHVEEEPPVTYTWETYKITVTDPMGYQEIYYWKGGINWGGGMSGPTEITDRNGNITRYFFGDPESAYLHIVTKGNEPLAPGDEFYHLGYNYMDYHYDNDGNRAEITKVADKYCSGGHASEPQLPCASRTTSAYAYQNGNVTSRTDAGGHQTLYSYDTDDNLISFTDPMQKTTTFSYDEQGNLASIVPPVPLQADITYYAHTPHGKLDTVTNARGHTTSFDYDSSDCLVGMDFPDGTNMSFEYDNVARLGSVTYPTGLTIGYQYDNLDRVTRVSYPDGTHEEYTYGCCGLESARDRAGRITTYTRDLLSRLTLVTDSMGNQTEYTYDPLGNVTRIRATRDGSLQTVVGYDYATPADDPEEQENHLNNLAAIIFPGGKARQFAYNWAGELSAMVLETGEIANYSYDDEGRLAQVAYPGPETTSYGYDSDDRITTVTHSVPGAAGWVTSSAYDARGRITAVDGPDANDTIAYTYDAVGNRATMSVNGIAAGYSYDPMNRLLSVTSPYASTSYAYLDGQLDAATCSNGDTVKYTYDALDRLSSLANGNSAPAMLASYTYAYGLPETITGITDNLGFTDFFQYDNIYRLTREKRQYPSGVIQRMNRFGYDGMGNRKRYSENGRVTTATFTQDNQIMERSIGSAVDVIGKAKTGDWQVTVNGTPAAVESDGTFVAENLNLPSGLNTVTATGDNYSTGGAASHSITITKSPSQDASYEYDDRGNMTAKTDSAGMTAYSWYLMNRLKRMDFADGTNHQYFYDGLGRRLKSIENGVERRFVYDGWNVIGERRAGSDEFVSYYTRGADRGGGIGGIISVRRNGASEMYPGGFHTGDYFYHYNHRGDVVSVTNSFGSEVANYRYDAFGNVVQKTGNFDSPYQFSTKEYDATSGLGYYGFRYYSPAQGIWLSKDPLGYGDELNLYTYVTNGPVNQMDPWGLWEIIYTGGAHVPPLPGYISGGGSFNSALVDPFNRGGHLEGRGFSTEAVVGSMADIGLAAGIADLSGTGGKQAGVTIATGSGRYGGVQITLRNEFDYSKTWYNPLRYIDAFTAGLGLGVSWPVNISIPLEMQKKVCE